MRIEEEITMWNRQELKSNARIMLKANYLKNCYCECCICTDQFWLSIGQRSGRLKAVMQISASAI